MLPSDSKPLLVVGAHPDDIEFGCGGVVAIETRAGRSAHFVVCSRGEAGTHGTPARRVAEAKAAAKLLGATLEFVDFGGDGHIEARVSHALLLAGIMRRVRPGIVLAPSLTGNQHPDHSRVGALTRDAARLARYGGVKELRSRPPYAIGQLYFYAVTPDSEPSDSTPILIDVSAPEVLSVWTAAMNAHKSQAAARSYIELQLSRARLNGLRAGAGHAIALFPGDPLVLDSLAQASRGARGF
jgi:LmbE family N-acetylglucosaminyl deacetylase